MNRPWHVIMVIMFGAMQAGCAAMFSGGPQSIEVKTEPPAAQFTYGRFSGITPTTIFVPREEVRNQDYMIFSKKGYQDRTVPLERRLQGITWLGLLWWPAFIIDLISGKGYGVDPSNINVVLEPVASVGEKINTTDESSHHIAKIFWEDARDYCLWAGKRLPTHAEWGKAASHFNMASHASEWTAIGHENEAYAKTNASNSQGSANDVYRVVEGSSTPIQDDRLQVINRQLGQLNTANPMIGFRCVQNVTQ